MVLEKHDRLSSMFRTEKKGDRYKIGMELDLPTNRETLWEFLTENYVVIVYSVLLFLINSGVFFGNLVIYGFVLHFAYLIILYFIWSLIFRVNPRFHIGVALYFLSFSAFSLWQANEPRASLAALVAFAFLSMGVFFLVAEAAGEKSTSFETEKAGASVEAVFGRQALRLARSEMQDYLAASIDAEQLQKDRSKLLPRSVVRGGWRRRLKLVGLASLIGLIVGTYFVASSSNLLKPKTDSISKHVLLENKVTQKKTTRSKKTSETGPKTSTKSVDRGRINIDVLNGNGMKGEAAIIANVLRQIGYKVGRVDNANSYKYAQTELQHKKGNKDVADLLARDLSQYYPCVLKENLAANFSSDIVLVLGKDKKVSLPQASVDKSSCIIDVLNGNGTEGSAKQVADDLKKSDFKVRNVRDANGFNYSQTIIQYKPGRKEIAEQIADLIKGRYAAVLKEDKSITVDIVLTTGKR